jgi:hypothetical protein
MCINQLYIIVIKMSMKTADFYCIKYGQIFSQKGQNNDSHKRKRSDTQVRHHHNT